MALEITDANFEEIVLKSTLVNKLEAIM